MSIWTFPADSFSTRLTRYGSIWGINPDWDIHVSGADVIGIQHAEVGDPAHRQMLWPLRLTKYPRSALCADVISGPVAAPAAQMWAFCAPTTRRGGSPSCFLNPA